VTLSASGSYRLTGNLDLTAQASNVDAIQVETSNVTIDLNGFTIRGAAVCTGSPANCTGTNLDGSGILHTSAHTNIAVRNGTITGMPGDAVNLPGSGPYLVEDVRLIGNGANGVFAPEGRVSGCSAVGNDLTGIHARFVTESEAIGNGDEGFRVEDGMLLDSRAEGNADSGLAVVGTGAYGRNELRCNSSAGVCNNGQQTNGVGLEIAPNVCGTDTTCP
jgi:hypothetical protein